MSGFTAINNLTQSSNTIMKNNLVYAPNATKDGATDGTQGSVIRDENAASSVGATGTMGNSSNSELKNTNPFASATPSLPADFRLTTDSYPMSIGVVVPVFSDFFLQSRPPYGSGAALP